MRFQLRYQDEIIDDFEAPSPHEAVFAPEALRAQRAHGLVRLETLGGGAVVAVSVQYRRGAELFYGWELALPADASQSGEFAVVHV